MAEGYRIWPDRISTSYGTQPIDSAKCNREPSDIGRGDCVMCVYCDDREKDRIWKILYSLGISKRIWKYDQQTLKDWEPGGRLRKRASSGD